MKKHMAAMLAAVVLLALACPGAARADQAYDTDIVVVGAGGAGMIAALTAAQAGRQVILVESQPTVGGSTAKASGGMSAPGTRYQIATAFTQTAGVEQLLAETAAYPGIEAIAQLTEEVTIQWETYQAHPEGCFDSVELMALDTLVAGQGRNDPELVAALCEGASGSIEWLRALGVGLTDVVQSGGASVGRLHRPLTTSGLIAPAGASLVARLEDACNRNKSITILLSTTAHTILTDHGAVCGIAAEDRNGDAVTVHARAVILATGGFGANRDMIADYQPRLADLPSACAAGAQGQGIAMATAIGAATVDMDQIQLHPTVQATTAALITEGLRADGAILISAEGDRFVDEMAASDVVATAVRAQTDSRSWLIFDQALVDASEVVQGYITKGYAFSAQTYEKLGAAIDVDSDALAETLIAWNACVEAGADPAFGRISFAHPLNTAPFYAIQVTAGIQYTMGGLKISKSAEVLSEDGAIIPGLFAAGEVTGGVHGAGLLVGNALADAAVFGRIAGASAALMTAEVE